MARIVRGQTTRVAADGLAGNTISSMGDQPGQGEPTKAPYMVGGPLTAAITGLGRPNYRGTSCTMTDLLSSVSLTSVCIRRFPRLSVEPTSIINADH